MIEEKNFETFLYISKYKFQIFVFDKKKLENLYSKELKIENKDNKIDLGYLLKFLDENIYIIEKLVGSFIKNIILITEYDDNLNVNVAIKKKSYENPINRKYLENRLIEIKDLFKENYQEQTIMHMLITNCIINEKKQSFFVDELHDGDLYIEVNFICISNDLTFILDELLKKYQIKISNYMCGNYIKNFFEKDICELSLMAYKLKSGFNNNEVILTPKIRENKGFFEKFFQLFS